MNASSASPTTVPVSDWFPALPSAPSFEHLLVKTPGLRSHVAVIGEGDPVVLLHGFPEHWWQWHEVAAQLAAHGYRAICPDLRGAGWTVADDPRVSRVTRLHDLLALLDALGIDRAHVVSHDMGALTAYQLAYEYPERTRSMVQLSVPPAFMAFSPKLAPAFKHLPGLLLSRSDRPLDWLFTSEYLLHPMSRDTLDAYLNVVASRPELGRATRTLTRGLVIPEALRLVTGRYTKMRLRPPTLVAFGTHDMGFPEELARRICRHSDRHADRFELAFIDDASHFVTDDAPDAVAKLTLDWFERAQSPA